MSTHPNNVNPTRYTPPGGVRRPNWICSRARQRVGIVRDASGSMSGQKAQDATEACRKFLVELANPANKDGFRIAVVDFSNTARLVHPLEVASVLAANVAPIDADGETNITAGLAMLLDHLEAAAGADVDSTVRYLRPVVYCFSDGCHNVGEPPHAIASRMKQTCDLVTVAFGSDADEDLLKSLASTPQHFYRCADGAELRQFLAKAGITLSTTLAQGADATRALADM